MKQVFAMSECVPRSLPGVVYGPAGRPLSDAIVRLPALNRMTRTGKHGEFNFETVPAETLRQLAVEAQGRELTVELSRFAGPIAIHFQLAV